MTLQVAAFDPFFHFKDQCYQPTAFAAMDDLYPMFNGRGYPDTVNTDPDPASNVNSGLGWGCDTPPDANGLVPPNGDVYPGSRPMNSLVTVPANRKFLLRIFSLATTRFYTVESPGIPMTIVGRDARILRGGGIPTGKTRYYNTNSVTLGGGEAIDAVLDTTGVAPGTYFLYARDLDAMNNNTMPRGGLMTEIHVTP